METPYDHLFPGWGVKHVELPPAINKKPETILQILHNHHLLVQNLCPGFIIKSIKYSPYTTTFALKELTKIVPSQIKITFTSFDDGISFVKTLGSGVTIEIRWMVTKTTTTPEQYFLRETFTASGDEISNIFYRFGDGYHRSTQYLVHFLGQIATGKASMSDVKRVQVNSSERKCVGAAKLKSD